MSRVSAQPGEGTEIPEDLDIHTTAGKLADLVVLSTDIMTIPADQIPSAHVDETLVGGKVVYQRMP